MTPVTPPAAPSRAASATSAAAAPTPARGAAGNAAASPGDAFAELLMSLASAGDGAAAADPSAVTAVPETAVAEAGAEVASEAASTMAMAAEPPAWAAWMPAMPQAADTASATSVLAPDAGEAAAVPGAPSTSRSRAGADKGKAAGLDLFAADAAPAAALPHAVPQAATPTALASVGASTQAVSQEALPAATPQAPSTPHAAWIAAPASFAAAMEAATGAAQHQAAIPSHPLDAAFAGDIAAEVKLMAEGGLQQAELRLNPAELGPVRIQLTVQEGTADISFAAAHATTREGLSQSLPALRDLLAGQGLQLGQAGVGAGTGGQGGHADPSAWNQPARSSSAAGSSGGGAMDPGTATAPAVQRRTRGLLDLYA